MGSQRSHAGGKGLEWHVGCQSCVLWAMQKGSRSTWHSSPSQRVLPEVLTASLDSGLLSATMSWKLCRGGTLGEQEGMGGKCLTHDSVGRNENPGVQS